MSLLQAACSVSKIAPSSCFCVIPTSKQSIFNNTCVVTLSLSLWHYQMDTQTRSLSDTITASLLNVYTAAVCPAESYLYNAYVVRRLSARVCDARSICGRCLWRDVQSKRALRREFQQCPQHADLSLELYTMCRKEINWLRHINR